MRPNRTLPLAFALALLAVAAACLADPDPRGGGGLGPTPPGDTLAAPGPGVPKTMTQGCKGYEEIPEGDPETCDPLVAVGDKPCGFGAFWSKVDGECRCLGNLEFDDDGICRFKGVVPPNGGPGSSTGNGGRGSNDNPGESDDSDPASEMSVRLQCSPGLPTRGDIVECRATPEDAGGPCTTSGGFFRSTEG